MKAEIDSIESLKEEHLETMQASVSISDLPSGVLEHILLSSCVTFNPEKCRDVVSMPQVKTLSSVCTKWHAVMLSSCERASHGPPRNPTRAQAGLRELRTLRNTTHVSASDWSNDSDTGFFRELASGFPLLTSFHLKLFGSYKVLDRLSSLLSLQTNIQELSVMFNNGMDLFLHGSSGVNGRRRRYWAALEGMDFASQAHLKRLTLDYMVQFPEEISYKRCFPVSPTIAQLAGLEELRIGVMAWVAPLPSWLVKLPALAGLTILDEWRERTSLLAVLSYVAGADFQRSLAGLRDLTLGAVEVCASEMDLLSTMGKLTALKLDLDPPSESPSTPRGDALLLLSPTLRKLSITGNLIPQNARPLPLLEDLTLAVQAAIQLDYFAFTPNLRKLDMVLTKGVARPHLGYLTQLTSLSLALASHEPADPREEAMWHICGAHTSTLQALVLCSCRLLPLVDGLLALERHVAVFLRCKCRHEDWPWFDSYAKYAAVKGGPCCSLLPRGDARQLFKDTRPPAPRPPAPGPCDLCPSPAFGDSDGEHFP